MKLTWLNNVPKSTAGVTWGIPWKQGELKRQDHISLKGSSGETTPVQSWPMAFWPDGTVKWTGHAAIIDQPDESYELTVDDKAAEFSPLVQRETSTSIEVDTGKAQFVINKTGNHFIKEIRNGSKTIGKNGKLIAIQEERNLNGNTKTIVEKLLISNIKNVQVEQEGPLRSVIKIEGEHLEDQGNRSWIPFVLRLYFFANSLSVKIVHTFLYNGNPENDFIKGLGMQFTVPLNGEAWNRNVRFVGDEGIFSEPAQLLLTRRHRNVDGLFQKQINGSPINETDTTNPTQFEHARQNAIWNDFKITQDSADHYRIVKRTKEGFTWIESAHGTRSKGLAYIGGEEGGLGVGVKNFWQKFPSTLEVNGLSNSETTLKVWFWSPDSEAMDLRHYNSETHVVSAYEGFDEMRSTPHGIANTSEIFLKCFSESPTHEELIDQITDWQSPTLLVCDPQYYYETKSLGVWSLPDRENPVKAKLEEELDKAIAFYKQEIEQRKWYGFWNYGDVMHTYDPVRHQWRYDLGGFAWQNTELVPNIWFWYAFLRSGREDIFIMAEAMTRHTSEVDVYHLGEYAGLGSRHNVVHWGCGCKEARISMAGLHKFYYYLTADERTGDLLTESRDADQALLNLDPMREFYPDDETYSTHARVGPDWSAFCSNWLCEWERTENVKYKEKILHGINTLKQLPFRLLSGPNMGYDPKTSSLHHMGDGNGAYHMVIAFGGPQAWMEIAGLISDEEWVDMLAEFGEFYVFSNEEKKNRSNGVLYDKLFSLPMLASGMVAYAAAKKHDEKLAKTAWNLLLQEKISEMVLPIQENKVTVWKELKEIPSITTNTTSQWCLNTIVALELIGDYLTEEEIKEVLV